jgi:hypothetical protein
MGQLKTGKVSLTKKAIEDIKKDAYFVKKRFGCRIDTGKRSIKAVFESVE